uniref:Uncharacterized protein n=1 Tax=Vespula pensylvanica TaxID=30213 RepID=A0A834JLQ4_VESPE|nr:hypothetical protein H0235_017666 [Vespula pensylvanica]
MRVVQCAPLLRSLHPLAYIVECWYCKRPLTAICVHIESNGSSRIQKLVLSAKQEKCILDSKCGKLRNHHWDPVGFSGSLKAHNWLAASLATALTLEANDAWRIANQATPNDAWNPMMPGLGIHHSICTCPIVD